MWSLIGEWVDRSALVEYSSEEFDGEQGSVFIVTDVVECERRCRALSGLRLIERATVGSSRVGAQRV
jgi:hypothetical protein